MRASTKRKKQSRRTCKCNKVHLEIFASSIQKSAPMATVKTLEAHRHAITKMRRKGNNTLPLGRRGYASRKRSRQRC
jgi:hypothetical protein